MRPLSVDMPGLTWSPILPPEIKIAIADALTLFSRIDDMIIRVLWTGEMADLKRKREIIKSKSYANLTELEAFVGKHMPGVDIKPTWDALVRMRRERNIIAHGVWGMAEGAPVVMWHEKMLESDDFETCEIFDVERFDRFIAEANHLLRTFQRYKLLLDKINEVRARDALA